MSNFSAASGNGDASGEIMLFGVRLVVDSMRKSVSLNNLSQYAQPNDPVLVNAIDDKDVGAGYASADEAVPAIVPRPRSPSSPSANASRERKRGIPWTEEEHKLFLLGLQKVGKGDWRGISRNFVKTRTPSQVASHAQKYFLRRSNLNRRRRRSSLFDITTESVCGATTSNNQQVNNRSNSSHSPLAQATSPSEIRNVQFSMAPMDEMKPVNFSLAMESKNWHTEDRNLVSPPSPIFHLGQSNIATTSMSSGCDLNLNKSMDISSPLSLSLSLSLSSPSDPSRQSPFQVVGSSFSNGDSMISVA